MAEKPKWINVRIPANSRTNKEIEAGGRIPAWKIIENIVTNQPKSKQEKAFLLYQNFVDEISIIYPGYEKELNFLRALIFRKILRISTTEESENLEPSDDYYAELKKL